MKLAGRFGTGPMPVRGALARLVVINAPEATAGGSVRVLRLRPRT
jgi:DNA-binding GntR family transcriptional regulator